MIKLHRKPCPNQSILKTDYKYIDNKRALMESSFGKCMYCESKIEHIDYGDVEHIMPKSKYPDRMFDWENLGYSCTKCNRDAKKDNYDPLFINPFIDDPQDYIVTFGGIYFSKDGNQRGQITIDILKLNRLDLLQKRYMSLLAFQELLNRYNVCTNMAQKEAIKAVIEDELLDDKEYSVCKRMFWNINNN